MPATAQNAGAVRRVLLFVALFSGLLLLSILTFSRVQDDTFDTAYWMERGDVRSMLEYRHLIQRVLPFWTWRGLQAVGIHTTSLGFLSGWDFVTAVLSLLLLHEFLRKLTGWRALSIAATFAYGTAHCMWLYAGSGRLYSTSMLLAIAAWYLALEAHDAMGARRLLISLAAGVLVCMGALFWMVQVFNAFGVGLLLLFAPSRSKMGARLAHFAAYSAVGTAVALAVAVSCLLYVQIPLEQPAISTWMASAGTQPMKYDVLGVMKASFGQANGHLVMFELPYMINGLMLKDPKLVQIGSLPWQLSKFFLVWILLVPIYLYPLWLMWSPRSIPRGVIFALYAPFIVNFVFALGWLGTDLQRFMPTFPSLIALGAISAQDWMRRARKPRLWGAAICAALAFIAADNLVESNLRTQRQLRDLAGQMKAIDPFTHPADLVANFGRDLSVTYQTMTRYYGGAIALTLTNDNTYYDWDSPKWQENVAKLVRERRALGGRVFLMDRVVLGVNPVQAAWSEKQHAKPTVREFAAHVRAAYCVLPGFSIGPDAYFELRENTGSCPAGALPPFEVNAQ